jgi:hypothetical protein
LHCIFLQEIQRADMSIGYKPLAKTQATIYNLRMRILRWLRWSRLA